MLNVVRMRLAAWLITAEAVTSTTRQSASHPPYPIDPRSLDLRNSFNTSRIPTRQLLGATEALRSHEYGDKWRTKG